MEQSDSKHKTESPIEKILVEAVVRALDNDPGAGLSIQTQVPVGKYRLDIAMLSGPDLVLAVECDGHNFHDRTKEQAARDRRRDRDILDDFDLATVRFTGSEIHHDSEGCADYCLSLARYLSYKTSLVRAGERAIFNQGPNHA